MKSSRKEKKFMVKMDGKTIHFGAAGMDDFTITGDEEQKEGTEEKIHGKTSERKLERQVFSRLLGQARPVEQKNNQRLSQGHSKAFWDKC